MAKKVAWTDQAKADVRAIDRQRAMHILHGLARFIRTDEGDVKRLQDIEPTTRVSLARRRLPHSLPRSRRHHRDSRSQTPLGGVPLKGQQEPRTQVQLRWPTWSSSPAAGALWLTSSAAPSAPLMLKRRRSGAHGVWPRVTNPLQVTNLPHRLRPSLPAAILASWHAA